LIAVHANERHKLIQSLREYPHAKSVYPFGDEIHYSDARTGVASDSIVQELRAYLADKGFTDVRVTPIAAGVEDAFMELMGQPEPVVRAAA
jgi:ABC-2 type transport system ATP-binding protein